MYHLNQFIMNISAILSYYCCFPNINIGKKETNVKTYPELNIIIKEPEINNSFLNLDVSVTSDTEMETLRLSEMSDFSIK